MKLLKKVLILALSLTLIFSCSGTKQVPRDRDIDLRIISTSDVHGKYLPYDYAQDIVSKNGSMAQIATILKNERTPNTILIGLGDDIQGNLVEIFNSPSSSVSSPIALSYNYMGYDYWVPGNHEFNFGMDVFRNYKSQLSATVLCANIYDENNQRLGKPYAIKEIDGVKVAIIGVTTPNIVNWDKVNLQNCTVTNPVDEIGKILNAIRGKYDLLVVAAHIGIEEEYGTYGSGAEDIIKAYPEIDVFLSAHDHSVIANKFIGETIISQNLNEAQTLAEVNIKLQSKKGVISKQSVSGISIKASSYEPDVMLSLMLKDYDKLAKEELVKVVGYLENGPLAAPDEIKGISTAKIQETALINLINDVQMYYTGAEISAAALFKDTANWQTGDIMKKNLADVYQYANTLYKLSISGKSLKKYLEWSASYYNQYQPGDLTISFDPSIRGYLYDMFSGINYDIDISQPVGSRIKNLTLSDGRPVLDEKKYTLAVNNYRANSQLCTITGGVFTSEEEFPEILEIDVRGDLGGVRELIGEYVKAKSVNGKFTAPSLKGNWRIIGNNWNPKDHQKVVDAVKAGKLKVTNSPDGRYTNIKSITVDDLKNI